MLLLAETSLSFLDKTDEEILESLDQDGNGRISKQEMTNFLVSEGLMNAGMEISDELWKAVTGGENELIIEQSAGNIGNRFGFLVILSVVAAIAASMPQECGRQPCDWKE